MAVAAIVGVYFCVEPSNREHVRFVAAVMAAAAGVYGAFYAGAAMRFNAARERQKRSFEILDAMGRPDRLELRRLIETIKKEDLSEDQVYALVVEDPGLWNSAAASLGDLEDMAIAIRYGFVEEQILYDSISHVSNRIVEKLHGYIAKLRKERRDNNLYCEIERLLSSWRDGKSLYSGNGFPKQ